MSGRRFIRSVAVGAAFLLITGSLLEAQTMKKAPANIQAVLDKTQDCGLTAYPLGFWNYANLNQHGRYMTRDEVQPGPMPGSH